MNTLTMVTVSENPEVRIKLPTRRESLRRAVKALSNLARDPNQLDQVLEFFFAVNARTMGKRIGLRLNAPEWKTLIEDAPRIDEEHVDYAALERLPEGTLGREYVRFLADNKISPAPFKTAPDVGDARVGYVMLRYRQTHDLWHVVTGYRTDIDGELMLQAFSYAQTGSPASFLIAVLGALRFALRGDAMRRLREGYALGKRLRDLGPVRWERFFDRPLADIRAHIGATPADLPIPAST